MIDDNRLDPTLATNPRDLVPANDQGEGLLSIRNLNIRFRRGDQQTTAVQGLDLDLRPGRITGVAGESGSGKSASALAVMGLLARNASVSGSIKFQDRELAGLPESQLRAVRGAGIAMIFQETGTALNPVMKVSTQLVMAARAHQRVSKQQALREVRAALEAVQLSDSDRVLRSYPHELSGGMAQRVMIAMALSCGSQVLLADEPTTALDVSVQREILELLRRLVTERQLAVMMISHDLAVLNELCDDLVVMYRGEVVERGPVGSIMRAPAHPYTRALLACLPRLHGAKGALPEMGELSDDDRSVDTGCRFKDRCTWRIGTCDTHPALEPVTSGPVHRDSRCWRADEVLHAPTSTDAMSEQEPVR